MANFNFIFEDNQIEVRSDVDFVFPDALEGDPEVARSYLGTPVLSNIVFRPGSYERNGQVINFDGLTINTVLITANQSKNIVTTPVNGRNGTVKEYISDGDYVITLNGAIVNETGGDAYPRDDVQRLIELLKVPEALQFTAEFLDLLGSFDLVVTGYDIPQTQGQRNLQLFTINCLSDNPIELQLNEEANL